VSRIVSTLVLAGAFAVAAAPAAVTPNVRGTVDVARSLYCPSDEPCDPPMYSGALVFSRSGHVVARAKVTRGRFALRLGAGRFALRLDPLPPKGKLKPAVVQIPSSGAKSLHLTVAAG
jgi:hypothetical protein